MGVLTLEVKVIPNASQDKILPLQSHHYKIYLRQKALRGKANEALREILGGYFGVSKTSVKILRGERTRNKVVEIHDRR